jgi:hypothetical protein
MFCQLLFRRKKMIIGYVRKNRRRIGVFVANSTTSIGWSKCNKKDAFDREKGIDLAKARSSFDQHVVIKMMPRDIAKALPDFQRRIKRYFENPRKKKVG